MGCYYSHYLFCWEKTCFQSTGSQSFKISHLARKWNVALVCSPPGSLIPGILQARTLEWVAISFSNAWKWKVKVKSCPTLSNPMDYSLPGSSIHRIFQARVLEWGAIAFSLSMSRCCHMKGTFSNHSQLWGAVVDISVDWQPIGIVKETKALNDRTLRSDITRKRKKERNQPSKGIFPLLYILFFFPTLQHTENIICFSTFQKTL